MNLRIERYRDALHLPPSGGGGCHAALLGAANLGVRAGLSDEQIAADLAANVHGKRKITAKEIAEAVAKARNSKYTFTRIATPRPAVNGQKLLDEILARREGFTEGDLWEASPVRINWKPEEDAARIIRLMYNAEDYLFIGDRFDTGAENVRRVADWLNLFESKRRPGPHIIPNPMSGKLSPTKDGKPSYRADSCVAQFRFVVVEFDNKPLDWQLRFWAGVKLPIAALIDSGGKSIHAWIRIDAANATDWTERVEIKLFDILRRFGVDGTSKNESRLSRMPGHFRGEKKRWQRVLYLNPAGGAIQ